MIDVQSAPIEEKIEEAPPALPDYLLSPNAVFKDEAAQWRYGRPPDYSKTRKVWEEGRRMNHAVGSLEQIVENLVKNWEVEASFKPRLEDWRTIDPEKYTFAMSGGPPQSAEHMLKVGTYNAIIAPNEYYDPSNSDFASSHKTFKRMMPTFAWEVIEVYSGPPKVVFKWRHWGVMKNDYVGFNNKGQKVTAKAHGGPIEIYGTTIAVVDDQTRVQSLDTYMDSLEMFRQIAPHGVVNSEPMNRKVGLAAALDADSPNNDGVKIAQAHEHTNGDHAEKAPENITGKHVSNSTAQAADAFVPGQGACPFMGSSRMDGATAPHPVPANGQNGDAMSVDGSSADTEFSDSVLISRENLVPESLPSMPTEAQSRIPSELSKATDLGSLATQQLAEMDVDSQITTPIRATEDAKEGAESHPPKRPAEDVPRSVYSSAVTGNVEGTIKVARRDDPDNESSATATPDIVDAHLEKPAEVVHPQPRDVEQALHPAPEEAIIAPADSEETRMAKEEMSEIRPKETSLIMNRE